MRRGDIKYQPPEVCADRINWERGVTAGGKDAKLGVYRVPAGNKAFQHGYRYGQKLELQNGKRK